MEWAATDSFESVLGIDHAVVPLGFLGIVLGTLHLRARQ
jgi:hypothetical protein